MGDHTEMRESTAFTRGCLFGLMLTAVVALAVGFLLLLGGVL
jgi:hypothetical protein